MKNWFLMLMLTSSMMFAEGERDQPLGSRRTSEEDVKAHEQARYEREKNSHVMKGPFNQGVNIEYSSHMGAFHHPILVGEYVQLEDGSRWLVSYGDHFVTYNWRSDDTIKIVPNTAWFSSYNYRLENMNSGESVAVNLYDKPTYQGGYTYWITGIDYYNQQLSLSDGTIWSLSAFDFFLFSKWLAYDTVILGHNKKYGSLPNILINCNTMTHVEAKCLNQ